jgi:hypothetical protein
MLHFSGNSGLDWSQGIVYEQEPVSQSKAWQADGPEVAIAQGATENAAASAFKTADQARRSQSSFALSVLSAPQLVDTTGQSTLK